MNLAHIVFAPIWWVPSMLMYELTNQGIIWCIQHGNGIFIYWKRSSICMFFFEMFSNLNSIIRRGQAFHVWRPRLNTKGHMYFPLFPFSQQNPWPCIPVSMDFFHPNRNKIFIIGRGIWNFYISTSRLFTTMFNLGKYIIVPLMNVTWYCSTSDTVQHVTNLWLQCHGWSSCCFF